MLHTGKARKEESREEARFSREQTMFYISEISVSLPIEALHDPVSRLSAFGCIP